MSEIKNYISEVVIPVFDNVTLKLFKKILELYPDDPKIDIFRNSILQKKPIGIYKNIRCLFLTKLYKTHHKIISKWIHIYFSLLNVDNIFENSHYKNEIINNFPFLKIPLNNLEYKSIPNYIDIINSSENARLLNDSTFKNNYHFKLLNLIKMIYTHENFNKDKKLLYLMDMLHDKKLKALNDPLFLAILITTFGKKSIQYINMKEEIIAIL